MPVAEGPLGAWLKRKPADVDFRRVPVIFNDSWTPSRRSITRWRRWASRAAEPRRLQRDTRPARPAAGSEGPLRLVATKASTSRNSWTRLTRSPCRAGRTVERNGVPLRFDFTPAVVVNGRFLTAPSMTSTSAPVDYDRFLRFSISWSQRRANLHLPNRRCG